MIEAGFEFSCEPDRVATVLAELPFSTRPVHFSHEEQIASDADQIVDRKRFLAFIEKSESGFFMLGPKVTYSIRSAGGITLKCDCFIDVTPDAAIQFMKHMARAKPIFGFACASSERVRRNQVVTKFGDNVVYSWVGRGTEKYVPGFYWLTLLSDNLAKRHIIPLSSVVAVAQEHIDLGGGQRMFRFYERPEDWQNASAVNELCSSLPGVFDIEQVAPLFSEQKDLQQLMLASREWR